MSANYPAINPREQTRSHRTLGGPLDLLLRSDQEPNIDLDLTTVLRHVLSAAKAKGQGDLSP